MDQTTTIAYLRSEWTSRAGWKNLLREADERRRREAHADQREDRCAGDSVQTQSFGYDDHRSQDRGIALSVAESRFPEEDEAPPSSRCSATG